MYRTPEEELYSLIVSKEVSTIPESLLNTVNVNCTFGNGSTPLMEAVKMKKLDVCQGLLSRGARVNDIINHETILNVASFESTDEIVALLLSHKADVTIIGASKDTVLHNAANHGNGPIIDLSLAEIGQLDGDSVDFVNAQNASLINEDGLTALQIAEEGKKKEKVNAYDKDGYTLLISACLFSELQEVESLIGNNADVNRADKAMKWTPLLVCSAMKSSLPIMKMLVESKADVNHASIEGATPLHSASRYGHLDMVKYLVANNANVNHAIDGGFTPLHSASQCDHLDIVKYLVANNASVSHVTDEGFIPLYLASYLGRIDIVKFLVANNADANHASDEGYIPLHAASMTGHLDIAKYLVDNNADVSNSDRYRFTPLYWASMEGHLDIVKYLIANTADVSHTDNDGRAALSIASGSGHIEVITYLLENFKTCNQQADDLV